MKKEIWKKTDIENVFISNFGNIKNINEKTLNSYKGKNGYLVRRFKIKKGEYKTLYVHRIVALAFIKNPKNKKQVNHKNGIKNDNRVSNLEWVTNQENAIHSWKNGLSKIKVNRVKGNKINTSKLNENQVKEIRNLHENKKYNMSKLGKMFNVSKTAIRYIIIRRNWEWL